MTELAIRRPDSIAEVETYTDATYERLRSWAIAASATHEVAESIVQTSFCPAAFRDKPHEATAAILAGFEVGLSPMAALGAFDVIQGRAAARAITLRAIVQSKGHEVLVEESTSTRCIMAGHRKGATKWQRSVWTIDRAKELGLTGKDQWRKQPQAMLIARATSELCRLVAADAILGIPYSAEEIEDGVDPDAPIPAPVEAEPEQPKTRRMGRKRAEPAPQTGGAGDTPAAAQADDPASPPDITSDNSPVGPMDERAKRERQMFALFRECGIEGRDAQLAFTAKAIGRDLGSRTALDDDELAVVIAELQVKKGDQS